jgi:hypothetical protein
MKEVVVDSRLSAWLDLRKQVNQADHPLELVNEFWREVPFTAYNREIDQYNPKSWPTPWEIIANNKYDDFTLAIMIGFTLLLTNKYANSYIEVKTMVDKDQKKLYNVVCVDNDWALNYSDGPIKAQDIPDSFHIENLVVLERPR